MMRDAMYCPECGTEFRPGFTECSDCHVPLVPEKPQDPDALSVPDPDLALATVFEGNDPLLVAAAKSSLEQAGIPFYVAGEELAIRLGPVGALINPWCTIQVAADREPEARELLQQLAEKSDDTGEPA
jgi:hypothetical protein